MNGTDRLKIFAIGLFVGCFLVALILARHRQSQDEQDPSRQKTALEMQLEVVPGVVDAYENRRVPMESRLMAADRRTPVDEAAGIWRREILLQGMEPGQGLLIEERIIKDRNVPGGERVAQVRILRPDGLLVALKAGYQPSDLVPLVADSGVRFEAPLNREKLPSEAELPNWTEGLMPDDNAYWLRLEASSLDGVAESVSRLRALDSLVRDAQPVVYIDFELPSGYPEE